MDLDTASDSEIMDLLKMARPTQDEMGKNWTVEQSQAVVRNQNRDTSRSGSDSYAFDNQSNSSLAVAFNVVVSDTFLNVHVSYGTIAAGGNKTTNFTLTGAIPGDYVMPVWSVALPSGITVSSATVISTDTASIILHNSNGVGTTLTNPTNVTIYISRM